MAEQVSKEMSKDSIVVFDEAHNIGESKLEWKGEGAGKEEWEMVMNRVVGC